MKNIVGILLFSMIVVGLNTQNAMALTQFKKAFTGKYVENHKSKEFQAAAKKASCNVCHIKGAKKTVHNEYGELLSKLIEGDAKDRKDAAKKKGGPDSEKKEIQKLLAELDQAFKKVGEMKSQAGKGPEYAKLIKEGQLPVDPVEAVAKYKAAKAKEDKEKKEAEK